jgi:hypothetical protein
MSARFPPTGDTPLDRIRREYDLPPATASLLLELVRQPPGRFVPRAELAQSFGRSHLPACVQPQLDLLRKKVGRWDFMSLRSCNGVPGGVAMSPALRERLLSLLA